MMNIIYIIFQISTIIFIMLLEQNFNYFNFENKNITKNVDINSNNDLNIRMRSFSDNVLSELKQVFDEKKINSDMIDDTVMIGRFIKKHKLENILKARALIIDLNSIDMSNNNFLYNLSIIDKLCFVNSIILFIIGERKTYSFLKELKYFNLLNYISPYNYFKSWIFGSPIKMEIGKIGKNPYNVPINNMISDISNQYGVLLEDINIINFNPNNININYIINHSTISL